MSDVLVIRKHRARRVVATTVGAVAGVLVLALGAVLAVGGIFVPAGYLQPWTASYYQQFSDPRLQVVAHAVLAPSGHNMQPWTVRVEYWFKVHEEVVRAFAVAHREDAPSL